jgi:hypothetical protein
MAIIDFFKIKFKEWDHLKNFSLPIQWYQLQLFILYLAEVKAITDFIQEKKFSSSYLTKVMAIPNFLLSSYEIWEIIGFTSEKSIFFFMF